MVFEISLNAKNIQLQKVNKIFVVLNRRYLVAVCVAVAIGGFRLDVRLLGRLFPADGIAVGGNFVALLAFLHQVRNAASRLGSI